MSTVPFSVAVLAGGLATRLRPLTEHLPKSLIEVGGEPFIHHQLRQLKKQRINNVVLCVGYLGEKIEELVGNGHQFGLEVRYSYDGEVPLGTGGALKKALPLLSPNFFVLYGDSYLDCSFAHIQTFFLSQTSPALMTVLRNQNQWDQSNVEFSAGKILAYHKSERTNRMHYIDYGLGILSQALVLSVDQPTFDLSSLYQLALENNTLSAYEVHQRFYEIGSFDGIKALEIHLNRLKTVSN